MKCSVDELAPGARVLVVRLRSLGDCVLTTPALALLKAYRPDVRIGVMVEPRFAQLFELNSDVDRILAPRAGAAAAYRPALTLNFHGGTRSVVLTAASLAGRRAGFGHYRTQWVYNVTIPRAQEILGEERKVHTAEHLASAMFYLGVPRAEVPRAKLVARAPREKGRYAVVHPFASAVEKAWPAERFAELCGELRGGGYTPIVLGGPGDDLAPFAGFRTLAGAPLDEVKTVLSGAALFVGNDSGPAHMAAAFAVPVVVLYGSSDPVIWAPWRTRSEVLTAPGGLAGLPLATVRAAVERLRGAA